VETSGIVPLDTKKPTAFGAMCYRLLRFRLRRLIEVPLAGVLFEGHT
jgi:hypothetical protein